MSDLVRVPMNQDGLEFSKWIQGYWGMADWGMSKQQHIGFLQQHIDLGITTVDHVHVYGQPSCEQVFGDVLKLAPLVRDQIEIVIKLKL